MELHRAAHDQRATSGSSVNHYSVRLANDATLWRMSWLWNGLLSTYVAPLRKHSATSVASGPPLKEAGTMAIILAMGHRPWHAMIKAAPGKRADGVLAIMTSG